MFVIINIFLLNRFYSNMPKLMPIDAIRLHCVRWPRRYALQMFDIAESWDHCYPLSVYKTKWDQDYKNFEKKWVREETIQQFATVAQNYYKIDQPCAIHRVLVTELKTYSANGEDPCDIELVLFFQKTAIFAQQLICCCILTFFFIFFPVSGSCSDFSTSIKK